MGNFNLKQGVCVLISWPGEHYRVSGSNMKFVGISRRNNITQFGIPGGKVDPGETTQQAGIREIEEECGIRLTEEFLVPIYSGMCFGADGKDYWVTTYLYTRWPESEFIAEEGLVIIPITLKELCDESVSPFAEYNKKVASAHFEYAYNTLQLQKKEQS